MKLVFFVELAFVDPAVVEDELATAVGPLVYIGVGFALIIEIFAVEGKIFLEASKLQNSDSSQTMIFVQFLPILADFRSNTCFLFFSTFSTCFNIFSTFFSISQGNKHQTREISARIEK